MNPEYLLPVTLLVPQVETVERIENISTSPEKTSASEALDITPSLKYINSPVSFPYANTLINRIRQFKSLTNNWDNNGAVKPGPEVINNSINLISKISRNYLSFLNEEDITPTPYGTIVIDWYNKFDELVSIEIGYNKLGYFTEINHSGNPENEIDFSDNVAKEVTELLSKLY